jgi:hypothetical protein
LDTDASQFNDLKGINIIAPLTSQGFVDLKHSLKNFVQELDPTKANRVFIRSINPLIVLYVMKDIHEILTPLLDAVETLTVTVSQEVLGSSTLTPFLCRMTTTAIVFVPSSHSNELNIITTHKKKHSRLGFKIEERLERIKMTSDGFFEVVKESTKQIPGDSDPIGNDLKGLTFNLQLSDQQKSAKDQVQLPYIK